MSWMDSWSRPNKSQATPPPLYLTQGDDVPYCHTCGRVIGSRRANTSKASSSEVKFCSDRCKRHRHAPGGLDRRIEDALVALLLGREVPPPAGEEEEGEEVDAAAPPAVAAVAKKPKPKTKKGDPRILVRLSDVETAVFGHRQDPEKVHGRKKNRARRGVPDAAEWRSVDMEDAPPRSTADAHAPRMVVDEMDADADYSLDDFDEPGGVGVPMLQTHVRLPQARSEINGSVGGEKGWAERVEESPEMLQKRREGQKKAEEKELVRNVARRAVVFGLLMTAPVETVTKRSKGRGGDEEETPPSERRKCEALMNGNVVEPSFAKGDWTIRLRED